jgi:uncharacterized Zn finger protein
VGKGTCAPGDKDIPDYSQRFRITSIMEALADVDDDFDALVAVKARDLSILYRFLEVAMLYDDAGEPDRALEWADRGWRAFPAERQDARLRNFLARAFAARARHDDAIALTWPAFAEAPNLRNYLLLEEHAKTTAQWPAWREKALSLIRTTIARESAVDPGPWTFGLRDFADHSLLVDSLLHEGDVEAAWEEAQAGGCNVALWLTLAEHRKDSHPADAVEVYRRHVAEILRHTGDNTYLKAVEFIGKIEELHLNLDQEEAFHQYLAELRTAHRRKRKLMQMFDGNGW